MLELLECMDLQSTIVRTYIQCDMHDGGEGGLHPPPLSLRVFGILVKEFQRRERGVVSISLAVAHFGSS